MDAGEQADEIILAAESEHGVDEVVADTGFALLDLEAVGEEIEDGGTGIVFKINAAEAIAIGWRWHFEKQLVGKIYADKASFDFLAPVRCVDSERLLFQIRPGLLKCIEFKIISNISERLRQRKAQTIDLQQPQNRQRRSAQGVRIA